MINDQQRLLFWLTVPTHDPTHSWAMGTGQVECGHFFLSDRTGQVTKGQA